MKYSKEYIEKIYNEDYIGGNGIMRNISKKYNIDIPRWFKKYGLKIISYSEALERRRKKVYGSEILKDFSVLDKNMVYILGLIYADGWISDVPNKHLGIKLKASDSYILDMIKNYISSGVRLRTEKTSKKLVISSKKVFDNLVKLGLEQNKTSKKMVLPSLPKELLSHFIRGLFDGDGSIFRDGERITFNICSPDREFLEEIKLLFENVGIYSNINTEVRKGKTIIVPQGTTIAKFDMHRLFIRREVEIQKIYCYLYKDCDEFFLIRKKSVFDKYFAELPKSKFIKENWKQEDYDSIFNGSYFLQKQ